MNGIVTLAILTALGIASNVVLAQSSGAIADPKLLVRLWTKEYETCRGSYPDDPRRDAACAAMDTYETKLHVIGWCYGKEGQSRAEMSGASCLDSNGRPSECKSDALPG